MGKTSSLIDYVETHYLVHIYSLFHMYEGNSVSMVPIFWGATLRSRLYRLSLQMNMDLINEYETKFPKILNEY